MNAANENNMQHIPKMKYERRKREKKELCFAVFFLFGSASMHFISSSTVER